MADEPDITPSSDDATPRPGSRPGDRPGRPADGPVRVPPAPPPRSPGSRFWLIPAATFLVGLLLGAVVIGLSRSGDGTTLADGSLPDASRTATAPTTSPTPRTAATVTVPGPCLDVADSTEELLALVRQATEAARDLNAAGLSAVVRQLQESQARLQQQSTACRDAASAAAVSPTAT